MLKRIYLLRFVNRYMELEKSGADKGELFEQVAELLKSEGLQLKTLAEVKEVNESCTYTLLGRHFLRNS